MIIDSFDLESEPIITPKSFFGEKNKICDIMNTDEGNFIK